MSFAHEPAARRSRRSGPLRVLLAFPAVLVTPGCAPRPVEPPGPEDGMWVHFSEVATLQLAVARGDLARARAAAQAVEEAPGVPGVPGEWEREMLSVRRWAAAIRAASNPREAAGPASRLAAACGACHLGQASGPVFSAVPAAPEAGEVDHMVEHVWAADRMWEGLVIPSDERWAAGARILADHGVPMDILARGTSSLGVQLKSLGLEAMGDVSSEDRVLRYTRILETCADCHRRSSSGAGVTGA